MVTERIGRKAAAIASALCPACSWRAAAFSAASRQCFEAHLAGMGEDGRAVALGMLVEPDAGAGLGHDRCERGLADLKRIAPQVIAVQFDEVEGDCPEDASRK